MQKYNLKKNVKVQLKISQLKIVDETRIKILGIFPTLIIDDMRGRLE